MNLMKKLALFFITFAVVFFSLSFYSIYTVNSQVISSIDKVQKNSFIGKYEISDIELEEMVKKLNEIEKDITDKNEVKLIINDKEYTYKLSELKIGIDKNEIINNVSMHEENLDYWTIYNSYSKNNFEKVTYNYNYVINEIELRLFLTELKKEVDVIPKKGTLTMNKNRVLEYLGEVVGYNLDVDKSLEVIKENFKTINYNNEIVLVGDKKYTDDKLKTIDSKISSFTTTFDDTVSRKYNLIAGAKYIDGVIVYPNETFSFFKTAGPYTKEGYTYYLGVKGNGVCQVATTLYNAQLLAGLETVTRYHHGTKSVYVSGGLDATVSVTRGYVTDYKFKNNLEYPIYISAYTDGGKLTVEIWSNKDAKKGYEYKTESVRLGYGSYVAYRHAYKDGKLVNTENLGRAYYFSE